MTQGAYRRRIEVATRQIADAALEARVAIEDDHHRFRISVFAVDGVVSEVASQTLRAPTLMCPSAGPRLQDVVGMPLDPSCAATTTHADPRQQCTHLIEMAGLATSALARGIERRTYQAEVADPVDGLRTATLRRDGEIVLQWRMDNLTIAAPAFYAGQTIHKGFTALIRTLALEDAEAAIVLRRAVYTGAGRGMDLDAITHEQRASATRGLCWAWQPQRADRALRNIGSTLDFSDRPAALTADDRDWIAFAA